MRYQTIGFRVEKKPPGFAGGRLRVSEAVPARFPEAEFRF